MAFFAEVRHEEHKSEKNQKRRETTPQPLRRQPKPAQPLKPQPAHALTALVLPPGLSLPNMPKLASKVRAVEQTALGRQADRENGDQEYI